MSQLLQFVFSGLTSGVIYALVALGFTIIYNASGVVNFAQGEFVMLGGLSAALLSAAGMPLPIAVIGGLAIATATGLVVEKLAIEPARGADPVTIIIITIGVSLVLRGVVQVAVGKGTFALPAFSGDDPLIVGGAALTPQGLWALAVAAASMLATGWYFERTLAGKAMRATSHNRLAAQLVGIDTRRVLLAAFGLSALLGAIGGVVVAPITFTSYETGVMLGVKGFVAAVLGGMGSGHGAVVGGLVLGLMEALTAGYISSAYKDAVPFVLILATLFVRPHGLLGRPDTDRV